MSILEAEQKYAPEQLLLIDKLNEFKRPRAPNAKGKDTNVYGKNPFLAINLHIK
jgi:hypothetical protein